MSFFLLCLLAMGYFVCFEIILARLKYCSLNFQPHDSPMSFDPIARGAGVEGVDPWYLILLWIRDPERDEPLISITNMLDKQVYLSSQEMSAEHRRAQGDSWDAVYSSTTLVIWSFYYCQGQQNSCSWDNIFCCAAEVSATKTFTPYNACRAKRKHE